jgi:hypothetical protein
MSASTEPRVFRRICSTTADNVPVLSFRQEVPIKSRSSCPQSAQQYPVSSATRANSVLPAHVAPTTATITISRMSNSSVAATA